MTKLEKRCKHGVKWNKTPMCTDCYVEIMRENMNSEGI